MKVQCERISERAYLIIEPDGTKRIIPPLVYGQMIREYKWIHYYDSNIPKDYFEKAVILSANGCDTWYNYDYWVKESNEYPEYFGLSTEEAISEIEESGDQ